MSNATRVEHRPDAAPQVAPPRPSGRWREWVRTAAVLGRNALLAGNLQTLRLLGQPVRMGGYMAESLFLYRTYADRRGLPQKTVDQVLGGGAEQTVTLGNLGADTWFTPTASYVTDLVSLCLLCRILDARRVFEIGTLHGYTALHFALNTADDAQVFTLDLPPQGVQPSLRTTVVDDMHVASSQARRRRCFEDTPAAGRIVCLEGDSALFDYSPYHGSIDLFFIDGAHSYEYVRSDTLNALRCCRPGGVIAWHDFGRAGVNGVSRWLLELRRRGLDVYCVPGGSLAFMVTGAHTAAAVDSLGSPG